MEDFFELEEMSEEEVLDTVYRECGFRMRLLKRNSNMNSNAHLGIIILLYK